MCKISGLRWSHAITDMVNSLKENRHAMGLKFLRDIGRPLCIVIGWLGSYLTYLQVRSGWQEGREKTKNLCGSYLVWWDLDSTYSVENRRIWLGAGSLDWCIHSRAIVLCTVLRSRRSTLRISNQVQACLCWEILLTLIHGSNEGHWSILMSSNPPHERIFKEVYGVLRCPVSSIQYPCTPYNRRCLFHARYNAPSARGVKEWLFCSWSGVACTPSYVYYCMLRLKKHARK